MVKNNQTEEPTLSLKELLSAQGGRKNDILKTFQKIFPEFNENELETISSFKMGLVLPRKNSNLVKYVSWAPNKSAQADGLTRAALEQYLEAVNNVVKGLGPNWGLDVLNVTPSDVTRNWSNGVNMANHHLWLASNKKEGVFDAPSVQQSHARERGFNVEVRLAVVNPDNPSQVWQMTDPVALPAQYSSMSPKEQKSWWDSFVEENPQYAQDLGIASLPRVMRPQMRLIWNTSAPDGTTGYDISSYSKSWEKTQAANVWTQGQKEKIVKAYHRAGRWAAFSGFYDVLKSHSQEDSIENVDWNSLIEAKHWDLFDQTPPSSLEEFDQMMLSMQKTNAEGFKIIKEEVIDSSMGFVFDKSNLNAEGWEFAPSVREWIASRSWFSSDVKNINILIEKEKDAFENTFGVKGLSAQIQRISEANRQTFKDLAHWNEFSELNTVLSVLSNIKEMEKIKDVEIEEEVNIDPVRAVLSDTDWQDLLAAFDVKENTNEEKQAHPFSNWMERLGPPKDVQKSTQKWLVDNERFNDINRLILRKKDADEVNLNTELAQKLQNVLSVSNKIMQENQSSGGFWGRLRRGASEGVTADQWADSFLDFQNHMLTMFDAINKQVERDRIWLRYADELGMSAQDVDRRWSGWLADTARDLHEEHEQSKDQNITSEKKIEWNTRADTLDSARVAHEHIRTANGITNVLLEKVRQSADVKERLQQRSMMFYWSSLNMFAGLQSLQRNTNAILEQSEMVEAMTKSFEAMTLRSMAEETEQKEKLRAAFRQMTESDAARKQFYDSIASFQKDAVVMLGDLNIARNEMQEETLAASVSAKNVSQRRKKTKAMSVEAEPSKTSSTGPRS